MERKYLGLSKNVCFGLCYLIPIIAIIVLATDKELDSDEKAMMLASCLNIIASSVTCGIFGIIAIVAAIKYFMNDFDFKMPLLYNIASSILGN